VHCTSETKACFVIINVIVRLQRANTGFFEKSLPLRDEPKERLRRRLVNRLLLWELGPVGGGGGGGSACSK